LRDELGKIVKWYGTATDIDDRKRAEGTLRQSAAELQALSRRLVELQESERKELARELHDRVGQSLTALDINFAILRGALSGHDAALRSRLEDSAALLGSTAQAIENVVAELRPPMLDDYGLRAALDWYAHQFSARAGIAVSVRASGPDQRVAPEAEIALFRIAQEALNNVAKHAQASKVAIVLERRESEYLLSVADDGVGLRAPGERADPHRPGFGMVTMRERAQALGGRFQIESLPGGGTELTVRIAQ
jgi:two-component system sensor histidine kinase UhpB